MNSNDILRSDYLDILFENRNKQYGAYTLRKYYNRRLFLSISLAFVLITPLLFLRGSGNGEDLLPLLEERTVTIIDVKPLKQKPRNKIKTDPARKPVIRASARAFTNRVKIVEKEVSRHMPAQAAIINVSDEDVKGPSIVAPVVPGIPENTGGMVSGTTQPSVSSPALIQREPEFPGGMKAWVAFLRKHLQVPAELEAGEKKTVMIRFMVSADGSVTGFDILQSGGSIYDKEVIRVLKRMPKWKPALQNSVPVARSFTQPVTFVGLEE